MHGLRRLDAHSEKCSWATTYSCPLYIDALVYELYDVTAEEIRIVEATPWRAATGGRGQPRGAAPTGSTPTGTTPTGSAPTGAAPTEGVAGARCAGATGIRAVVVAAGGGRRGPLGGRP